MNIFDVVGPVMVGPSSSHTAGAVRIGNVSRKLLGEEPVEAKIGLHGSFLATGAGHGTDRALIAGLLGLSVDDYRIPDSFSLAREHGLRFRELEVVGASIGGGRILIRELDGLEANFSGDYPTLIVHNLDQPGHVAEVTSMLSHKGVNIATMQLYRSGRGGYAVMILECDQEIPEEGVKWLEHLEGVVKVTYYSLLGDGREDGCTGH